jgi:hypothetical protein
MTTRSIHLLLLVLPLACSSAPASNSTTDRDNTVAAQGLFIRPRLLQPVLVGGVKQLAADVPGGSVTWRSSDPEVAVVSETGLVRGRKVGRSTVSATVTYPNGTSATASVGVTVRLRPDEAPIASRRHRRR